MTQPVQWYRKQHERLNVVAATIAKFCEAAKAAEEENLAAIFADARESLEGAAARFGSALEEQAATGAPHIHLEFSPDYLFADDDYGDDQGEGDDDDGPSLGEQLADTLAGATEADLPETDGDDDSAGADALAALSAQHGDKPAAAE